MSKRKAIVRYLLIHLAELVVLAGALLVIRFFLGMPAWMMGVVVVLWVVKDVVLFPKVWRAYVGTCVDVLDELVGQQAVVTSALNPAGFVRVRGEIWRAELRDGRGSIDKGEIARVVAIRGMTLLVAPVEDAGQVRA